MKQIFIHQKEYSTYTILGSAYGTYWVYNDVESKKIKKEQLDEYLLNVWKEKRNFKFRAFFQW